MGWFFKKSKTNYVGKMREYVKEFMLKYIKDFPESSDVVIPIFSNAEQMIRSSSEKEISKSMEENGVNVECGALNIIQNIAMTELNPKSMREFINGDDSEAFNLYNYINKIKLDKGYISNRQYEENRLLATQLSMRPPWGSWF